MRSQPNWRKASPKTISVRWDAHLPVQDCMEGITHSRHSFTELPTRGHRISSHKTVASWLYCIRDMAHSVSRLLCSYPEESLAIISMSASFHRACGKRYAWHCGTRDQILKFRTACLEFRIVFRQRKLRTKGCCSVDSLIYKLQRINLPFCRTHGTKTQERRRQGHTRWQKGQNRHPRKLKKGS